MSTTAFVRGFGIGVKEEDLFKHFSAHGKVVSVTVPPGRTNPIGFVKFETEDECTTAIEKLNGSDLGGHKIMVSVSRTQESTTKEDIRIRILERSIRRPSRDYYRRSRYDDDYSPTRGDYRCDHEYIRDYSPRRHSRDYSPRRHSRDYVPPPPPPRRRLYDYSPPRRYQRERSPPRSYYRR